MPLGVEEVDTSHKSCAFSSSSDAQYYQNSTLGQRCLPSKQFIEDTKVPTVISNDTARTSSIALCRFKLQIKFEMEWILNIKYPPKKNKTSRVSFGFFGFRDADAQNRICFLCSNPDTPAFHTSDIPPIITTSTYPRRQALTTLPLVCYQP
ncbi:hypothetical protein BofuT4_P125240.1 [Botrytis cinerea T4]|uniref:Uncharacterized protein n=1 Tax=Botryotinia fuckeliana (strain T4) TaxID=999810 RepID=G2YS78_BOTF4|nr:hypothetical protein BofuT4_P125240.1 [Botrytis cinerea T4]